MNLRRDRGYHILLLIMAYLGAVTFVKGGMNVPFIKRPLGPVILEFPVIAGGRRRSTSFITPFKCGRVDIAFVSVGFMP